MTTDCPPITLALPGPVNTAVTPELTASLNASSSGLIASIALKWGVEGAVISFPSEPAQPLLSSHMPIWQWASIRPGVTVKPLQSLTSAPSGAFSPLPTLSMIPSFINTSVFSLTFPLPSYTVPFFKSSISNLPFNLSSPKPSRRPHSC